MNIPFVDLKTQYQSIKAEIDSAISKTIENTAFIGGSFVKQFERDFAAKYGIDHVVSCANGTDSLYILMKMLGIGPGDEVITVANSWISTSETISQTLRFDGKEYPCGDLGLEEGPDTVVSTKLDARTAEVSYMKSGRVTRRVVRTVSADGNQMTLELRITPEKGPAAESLMVFVRWGQGIGHEWSKR